MMIIFCLSLGHLTSSQEAISFFDLPQKQQEAFLQAVEKKYSILSKKVTVALQRTLRQLKKEEIKIYKKRCKKDSSAARVFVINAQRTYAGLEARVYSASGNSDKHTQLKEYIPVFDTIKTALSFIGKGLGSDPVLTRAWEESHVVLQDFETKMQLANAIKKQLRERKDIVISQLENTGIAKEFKKYNKTLYYYEEQLKEYKRLLKDSRKAEKKVIELLRKNSTFRNFMDRNSIMAQMFKIPGDLESISELQTRSGIAVILAQRFAGAGVLPQDQMRQQLIGAEAELNKIKNKPGAITNTGASDIGMPEQFKANTQKSKSFLQRFEYSATLQTQKLNNHFPATADIAFSVGYKLNDKSVVGIGGAFKLGLGKSWKQVKFTNEGGGLRSFVDMKLRGSLWVTGGFEQNYFTGTAGIQPLIKENLWCKSALFGLTKKVRMHQKKSGKVQLLYDLLYDKTNPYSQHLVFRIGWNL